MAVTIHDVARRAGTSIATVSHVLNSTGRITPKTRQRVMEAVKELGYHPNLHARNLASRASRTLGMIVSDIENPFFPQVIKAFETRARHRGYDVIVSDTSYEPRLTKRAAERMLEQNVRGVAVMTSEMSPNLIDEILRRRIAVTFFDVDLTRPSVSSIKIDYLRGVRQAVGHLYNFGHRRIAFVGGRVTMKNIAARQLAYVQCMRDLGLEPGPVLEGNQRFDGGLAAGEAILKLSPRPTAVIAMNDPTAIGVIRAFHRNGLRVPQDFSVVGFDRTRLAQQFIPSLTSVDMQPDLLGRIAADALHELSSSGNSEGREYLVPVDLVVGESTGSAPRSPQNYGDDQAGPRA